jgi:3-sulfinopropanoyl-CoA desulfinase
LGETNDEAYKMERLTTEQQALQGAARELAQGEIKARASDIDRSEAYPWDNVEALTDARFMGMTIPPEYGGRGLSYLDAVLVVEQMAQTCGITGRIVVEANMGAIGAVMKYGTQGQKKLAADLVLAGDKPAICITEPGAGSDASQMATRAEKRGDRYILNGRKHWITGAGVSKLHLIFAQVYEDGEPQGIGGFLAVRGESKGLSVGNREPAMGLRGIPEAEIILEDLEVSEDMAVIPPGGLKRGFAGLMNAYNGQRVGAATVALGIAQGAFELAVDYAQSREQFGRPIGEFQGLQWMVADMSVGLEASRSLIYSAAESGDGFPDMVAAARAKLLASETAIKVTNDSLQIFGAAGYSRNNPLERMVRDARMFTIGGGTAQMLRNLIGGQVMGTKTPQTRDGYAKLAER